MKKGAKFITGLLIALFLLGGIGAMLFFTDNGNEDFKSFVLSYEGEMIVQAKTEMEFEEDSTQRFDVRYIFDIPNAEPRDYSAKIVSNTNIDFEYSVDGLFKLWRREIDLTEVFALDKQDTYFTFEIPEAFGITEILNRAYPGAVVDFTSDVDENQPLFLLIVSSYNDAVTYRIAFTISKGESHRISYVVTYANSENSEPQFSCQETALMGEQVGFWISSVAADGHFQVLDIVEVYLYCKSTENIRLEPSDFSSVSFRFSFLMPGDDVNIVINIRLR